MLTTLQRLEAEWLLLWRTCLRYPLPELVAAREAAHAAYQAEQQRVLATLLT